MSVYGNSSSQPLPRFLKIGFDFSLAGYHQGLELPSRNIQGKSIFKVEDFGAFPNDGKDDIEAIQRAVDAAENSGGGVVLFPKGTFDFDVTAYHGFVKVSKSNVILRGWGDGVDGTILHDHHASHSPEKDKIWLGGTYPSFFKIGNSIGSVDSLPIISKVAPAKVGSFSLKIIDAKALTLGVYLLAQDNPPDSSLVKELVFPLKKVGVNHAEPGIKFAQMVRVVKNENGLLTLDAPINWRLDPRWNPRLLAVNQLIKESGVESFRLLTDWTDTFIHHNNDVHDSGWDHIQVSCLENGWFRNLTHDSPSSAVSMSWVKNCTVYDCQVIGNRGHNGFVLAGASTNNLLFNLKGGSTMHSYSLNGFCNGNVFFNCFTEVPSSIDCHGTLCHNNLFDNIYGAVIQNGGHSDALPPAHARGLVLYNIQTGYQNAYNFRIKSELLSVTNYPGVLMYGVRSMLGFRLYITDSEGIRKGSDFSSKWARVKKLNFNGALKVHSLFAWQHKKRYGNDLPE